MMDDSNQVISKLLADLYTVEHAGTTDDVGKEDAKWLADYLNKIQRAADGRCITPCPGFHDSNRIRTSR